MSENSYRSPEVPLTYKVLLVLTTVSSILFCWLYVTKPVEVTLTSPAEKDDQSTASNLSHHTSSKVSQNSNSAPPPKIKTKPSQKPTDFIPPSNNSLPSKSNSIPRIEEVTSSSTQNPIPLANTSSTKGLSNFEETNDSIQHIITAQNGNQSERIILDVPVIYQTRGLRLGPQQAEEARRILRALKSYKALVAKLHQDGKNISKAWELLLLDSQPIDALRADSPSLPQNSSYLKNAPTEKSAATISIEKNQ